MQQCLHGLKVGKPTSAKSHPSLILGHLEPLSVIDHLEMCLNVACVDSPPSKVPSSSFGDVNFLATFLCWFSFPNSFCGSQADKINSSPPGSHAIQFALETRLVLHALACNKNQKLNYLNWKVCKYVQNITKPFQPHMVTCTELQFLLS